MGRALLDQLTPREQEVFRLMAAGRSNREIADELYLSEGTVKIHAGRILAKLDLRDRVQAVVLAYESSRLRVGAGQAGQLRRVQLRRCSSGGAAQAASGVRTSPSRTGTDS